MPVEVKELVIRASVESGHELAKGREGEGEEEDDGEGEQEAEVKVKVREKLVGRVPLARLRVDREELVTAVVREVLRILRASKER